MRFLLCQDAATNRPQFGRSYTEAILASIGIEQRPFSKGAMSELPCIDDPAEWKIPEEEVALRRDLRGDEYYICSIDPPGKAPSPMYCQLNCKKWRLDCIHPASL